MRLYPLCTVCERVLVDGGCQCNAYWTSGRKDAFGNPVRTNAQEIAYDGGEYEGRPFLDPAAPTLRYADVFPGRVDPLDNDLYCRAYIALRAEQPFSFTVPARKAA